MARKARFYYAIIFGAKKFLRNIAENTVAIFRGDTITEAFLNLTPATLTESFPYMIVISVTDDVAYVGNFKDGRDESDDDAYSTLRKPGEDDETLVNRACLEFEENLQNV